MTNFFACFLTLKEAPGLIQETFPLANNYLIPFKNEQEYARRFFEKCLIQSFQYLRKYPLHLSKLLFKLYYLSSIQRNRNFKTL